MNTQRRDRGLIDILEDHEREIKRLRLAIARIGPGVITDHGALSGLSDNDHPQYSLTTHDHDSDYLGLAGGTLTGDLTITSDTLTVEDDDAALVAQNASGGTVSLQIDPTTNTYSRIRFGGVGSPVTRLLIQGSSDEDFVTINQTTGVITLHKHVIASDDVIAAGIVEAGPGDFRFDGDYSGLRMGEHRNAFEFGTDANADRAGAIYLGGTTDTNEHSFVGGIEAYWDSGTQDPVLGIGVVRDDKQGWAEFRYNGDVLLWNDDTLHAKFYGTSARVSLLSTTAGVDVYKTGIAYPGITHGGAGGSNRIGFTWSSPNIKGTIDNVVTQTLANTSDRRLKRDLKPITNAIEMWKAMPPVYIYEGVGFDGEPTGNTDVGMVADEMEQAYPWMVSGEAEEVVLDDEGQIVSGSFQTIDYPDVEGVAFAVIGELIERVERLEKALSERF